MVGQILGAWVDGEPREWFESSPARIFHQSALFRTQVIGFNDAIDPLPESQFVLARALRLLVGSFVPDSYIR